MRQRTKATFRLIATVAAVAMMTGGAYGYAVTTEQASLWRGALCGLFISVPLASLEIFGHTSPLLTPLNRLPFSIHLTVKTLIYLFVIIFGLTAAEWIVRVLHMNTSTPWRGIAASDVAFSLGVGFVVNFIVSVNRLLGQNVLADFVIGRYHRPKEEERIFLLLDLVGSTSIAERLGNVAFHQFLHRLFVDLGGPIVENRGKVHRYVGDELIATWRLAEGVADARCLIGCFDALARVERHAALYERDFGIRPQFRAGLHCGTVVSGEMGDVKREIVFLGDTVNVASRIVQVCRDLGHPVIASAALIDRLTLPGTLRAEPLGAIALRGKQEGMPLVALSRRATTDRR